MARSGIALRCKELCQRSLRGFVLVGVWGLGSCFGIFNWDPEGLACDENDRLACLEGYHCVPGPPHVCVRDHTRTLNQRCYVDETCQGASICAGQGCRLPCSGPPDEGYFVEDACPAGQYCQVYPHRTSTPSAWVGGCTDSDGCTPGAACALSAPEGSGSSASQSRGGVCVEVSRTAQSCQVGCEITWSPAGVYSDNCGGSSPQYCQPLGPAGLGRQRLVCLGSSPQAQRPGQACQNPVSQPCTPGAVCIDQHCFKHCKLLGNAEQSTCDPGLKCCAYSLADAKHIGYCASTCR